MKADVTIIPAAPRTYAVPKAVSSLVALTLSTPSRATAEPTVTDLDLELSKKLAIDGRITADDAFALHTGLTAAASSQLSYELRGGDVGREWAGKIVEGLRRDEIRERDAVLDQIGYEPDQFYYFGLSDKSDPELLRAVGRLPVGEYTLDNAEVLTAAAAWEPLSEASEVLDSIDHAAGTALPQTLLASSAAAFTTGFQAVYLAYATPTCFLDNVPLLASGIPDSMDSDAQFVYAIVDPTDTTAVLSLIMLKPGPQAFVRTGGSWVLDEPTLDALLSATPPPLVELTGPAADTVIQQVDASQSGQVAPNADGTAEAGVAAEEAPIEQGEAAESSEEVLRNRKSGPVGSEVKKKEESAHGGMPPRAMAAAAVVERLRTAYESGLTLTAAMAVRDGEGQVSAQTLGREARVREASVLAAISLRQQLEDQVRVLEDVIVPVVAASGSKFGVDADDLKTGQQKAAPLRRYWLHGVGAAKILWGTPGDWTRCVGMLSKYLGNRAKGYCSELHHSATGMWTGDAAHRALSGDFDGLKSRAKPAKHGISAPESITD